MACNPALMVDPLGLLSNPNNDISSPFLSLKTPSPVYVPIKGSGIWNVINKFENIPNLTPGEIARQEYISKLITAVIANEIFGGGGSVLYSGLFSGGSGNSDGALACEDCSQSNDGGGDFDPVIYKSGDFIALTALQYDGSTDWAFEKSKDNFDENTNKCNKFVYDVLTELSKVMVNMEPGLPNGHAVKRFFGGGSPVTAGQWADPNYHIPNWVVVSSPQRGDVVAVSANFSNATGHVGIMISPTQSIGASHNSVRITDFGSSGSFPSQNSYPGNNGYVYRRWSPGN